MVKKVFNLDKYYYDGEFWSDDLYNGLDKYSGQYIHFVYHDSKTLNQIKDFITKNLGGKYYYYNINDVMDKDIDDYLPEIKIIALPTDVEFVHPDSDEEIKRETYNDIMKYIDNLQKEKFGTDNHVSNALIHCPFGYEWVEAYKKEDGTYVKGFCRKLKRR